MLFRSREVVKGEDDDKNVRCGNEEEKMTMLFISITGMRRKSRRKSRKGAGGGGVGERE